MGGYGVVASATDTGLLRLTNSDGGDISYTPLTVAGFVGAGGAATCVCKRSGLRHGRVATDAVILTHTQTLWSGRSLLQLTKTN